MTTMAIIDHNNQIKNDSSSHRDDRQQHRLDRIASFSSSSLKAPNNINTTTNPSLASITNAMLLRLPVQEEEYSLEQKEEWLFGLLSQQQQHDNEPPPPLGDE
jgi:hypothetical protein